MVISFILGLFIIGQAIGLRDADRRKHFKANYQLIALIITVICFVCDTVPSANAYNDFTALAEVDTGTKKQKYKVDFGIVDKYYVYEEPAASYEAKVIYLYDGGYDVVYDSEYKEPGNTIYCTTENGKEYEILIPDIKYTFWDKLISLTYKEWCIYLVIWIIGIGSIFIYYTKKDGC